MDQFLSGATMIASFAIAAFFFKFWRKTTDQLFFKFAVAFALLGLERWLLLWTSAADESRTYVYFIRLAAFILIIYGIVEKNKSSSS